MTLHVSRLALTRLHVLALLVLLAIAAGATVGVLASHGSRDGKALASSRAGLGTFLRHYWWGHGRLFVIHRSGRGVEKLRTYAARPPVYASLRFEVVGVTGTPATADARIRVTSVRNPHHVLSRRQLRAGMLGDLRLRHGVIIDSITHATFCAPNVDRCGL
ncbi:MAG TPA: hypothetical protein VJ716_10090 [Gaiellaceae bacterium]|nr:hypothetical protein [Gaiellaceae bacterium]